MKTKYLTLNEVSDVLHIKVGTAMNRLNFGRPMPPSIKIGRKRLFPEDAFHKWMQSYMVNNDGLLK